MISMAAVAAAVLAVGGCGSGSAGRRTAVGSAPSATTSPGLCRHFSLSLAASTGGQSSPLAAASWFANGHNGLSGWRIPASGWKIVPGSGAHVRSGSTTLEVTRLSDGTWQVISGYECLRDRRAGECRRVPTAGRRNPDRDATVGRGLLAW